MIRDITIGQYYLTDSVIHRMDPRFKLVAVFVYVVLLFLINDVYTYAISTSAVLAVIALSRVPFKFVLNGVKALALIISLTALINMFVTRGATVYWQWHFLTLTKEGIVLAVKMVVRLILLVMASSILTLTTTPIRLTDAIEYLLKPLKRFHVPAHEIAMMMTIALRFIPTLLDETDKIIKAQQARGADFDTGGIINKAKSLVPILVPLFISAFRRADELAMAMEARCYRGDNNRTRMNEMVMTKTDYMGAVVVVAYAVVVIAVMIIL